MLKLIFKESEIANQYMVEQDSFKSKILELSQRLSETENSLKEKSRNYLLLQGEIEQERSVMSLKAQQMEINFEESKKKARSLEETLQNMNAKVSEDFREMSSKYEATIRSLQSTITELSDKLQDSEVNFNKTHQFG
jgi:hypothetical protein